MKFVAALLLFGTLSGCAQGTRVVVLDPKVIGRELYALATPAPAEERTIRVVVYFVRNAKLVAVVRTRRTKLAAEELAMQELLNPVREKGEAPFETAIPLGTELLRLTVSKGVADVNFPGRFELPEDKLVHAIRVAQVVWTLTELPNVRGVRFSIHGVHGPVADQDGIPVDVVTRAQYSRYAPQGGVGVGPCTLTEEVQSDPGSCNRSGENLP